MNDVYSADSTNLINGLFHVKISEILSQKTRVSDRKLLSEYQDSVEMVSLNLLKQGRQHSSHQ